MKINAPSPLFDGIDWLPEQPCAITYQTLEGMQLNGVHDEYALAKRFLMSYQGSEDTFNSYRREVERLCQWSWLIKQKLLKHIDRHDIAEYFDFVQNPPEQWVARKHSPRFAFNTHGARVPSPNWRPFLMRQHVKNEHGSIKPSMTQATIRAIMAGTSTFMTYLLQENYITHNPVSLIRQKSRYLQKIQQDRVTRKLNDRQWSMLIDEIESRCAEEPLYERHLFIFSAFYLLGCRISELADTQDRQPVMSDFYQDSNHLWWFRTVGKGNKAREIAVPDAMLKALKRYRLHIGTSGLPNPRDHCPIIPKQKGDGGIGTRQLRKIVQVGFDCAIERLSAQEHHDEAMAMRHATVHWLRHTAISKDVQHRPREHVRDDAGHQSVQVTDRYIEIDLQARHASARTKTLNTDNKETG